VNQLQRQSSEKPREKLIRGGVESLSTQELLMVLIGTGIKNKSVRSLAQQLLPIFRSAEGKSLSFQDFRSIRGIGMAKSCLFIAGQELFYRLQQKKAFSFQSPEAVLSQLQDLRFSTREKMVCLYLSARYRLVHKEIIAVGSLNQIIIQPRDIFTPSKGLPIAWVIIAHNHPSGSCEPSQDDIAFTKRVAEAGKLLGIELLDHIVVTEKEHRSLKSMGIL